MKKAKKKTRPRAHRRALERELSKIEDARAELARLSEGGAPERPVEVSSASVVESAALSLGCARCEGELALEEHAAVREGIHAVRRVRARCKRCAAERVVWLRIVRPS